MLMQTWSANALNAWLEVLLRRLLILLVSSGMGVPVLGRNCLQPSQTLQGLDHCLCSQPTFACGLIRL